ncbi:MAG: polysaccharide deacetylase family protein, partial [Candidatus Dormibacteraeota bacterium]|nr:polysaccharide deacetylase family protein [Candidatus Dormibacteraeota bacterium]
MRSLLVLLVVTLGAELAPLEPRLRQTVLRPAPAPVANAAVADSAARGGTDVLTSPTPPPPQPPLAVIPRGQPSVNVPILEYHYVRVNPNPTDQIGFNLSVTPADFAAQMAWLAGHGYHPIDLRDLRAYFAGQVDLPAQPVVLSFDDGYSDFYTAAWPVLSLHHFKAVSFVIPGFLGGMNYMTPGQLKVLDGAGIEIGSHT